MATHPENRSLSELEREAEHTRADLIHTVDALHERVSPRAIKQEVKEYARETGYDLIHTLEQKARENPLQAVAVAAGLAYPVWRFLLNIPAPILLIGAGIAVSQAGGAAGGRPHLRRSSIAADAEQLADSLQRGAQDASSKLTGSARDLKEKVGAAVGDAKSTLKANVETIGSRAAATINEATDTARCAVSDTVAAASEKVSETYRSGVEAASRTREQVTETVRLSKDTLLETIAKHPLTVGGIGLVIGGLIASALPTTPIENRLLGDTSDALKKRARDVAAEGVQEAQAAAGEVYEGAVASAKEQGLTPEVARQTIREAGEKVRTTLEKSGDALADQSRPHASNPTRT
jgi:ElaB/YqjD/DUF883 family membrane-anchored ribosome-binding protein